MDRRWIWISCGAALVVLLLLGLGLGARPLARRFVDAEAKKRGLELTLDGLSLGWGQVTLRDVRVRLEGVEGVEARLDRIEARVGWGAPRLRRLEVRGGLVRLEGAPEELRERLAAFRERHRNQAEPSDGAGGALQRRDVVRDLAVDWTFDGRTQKLSGVHFERGPEQQRLGVDLVTLELGALSGQVAGVELSWGSAPGRELERVHASEARVTYRAGAAPNDAGAKGATGANGAASNGPASADAAAGSGSGLLERFPLRPERVVVLRSALGLLREKVLPRLPPLAEIERLSLAFEKGEEKLHTGPHKLSVKREGASTTVTLLPGLEARGTPLALALEIPLAAALPARLRLTGGPLALQSLGVREGDFGLRGVGQASLEGSVGVELSADASRLTFDGRLALAQLVLESASLAPEPVRFPRLGVGGRGALAVDGGAILLEGIELSLGEARFLADLDLERGGDYVKLDARLRAPLLACQALVESAPRELLGPVAGARFEGTFSLDGRVRADTRDLTKMSVSWDAKNQCKVRAVPPTLSPERFSSPFQKEVLGAGGLPSVRDFGPRTASWTSISEIPSAFEAALLVTEDGRFFKHDGFDSRAIESSIRDNTRAGRFVRGASTLSMQLAKNLYLSRDKNLARKLQEAALTLLLEQSFDKRSIFELYLNVVEFGPGVYGVRQAAEYYFSAAPAQLTTAQCFFLASILPAPTRDYFDRDGRLSPRRTRHVQDLMRIARKRERLTEEELTAALAEELVFGRPGTSAPPAEGVPANSEGAPPPGAPSGPSPFPSPGRAAPDERFLPPPRGQP